MSRANTNAKEEFLAVTSHAPVKCAEIAYYPSSLWEMNNETPPASRVLNLKVGWDKNDWTNFLESLDFNYDSGYGGQELYGTVWFEDGTWMTRGEYDGSEWWNFHTIPEIPEHLY